MMIYIHSMLPFRLPLPDGTAGPWRKKQLAPPVDPCTIFSSHPLGNLPDFVQEKLDS
jgi:hypothetical protein